MVDQLGFLSDETVEIPTGLGGPFNPTGLISKWTAGIAWRVGYTPIDIAMDGLKADQTVRSGDGQSYCYYFVDKEKADEVSERYGFDIGPQQVWLFQTLRDDILTKFEDEETLGKFKPLLTYEIPVKTPRSKKHRHTLHLISLPAAVQAAALALGFLEEPVFNLSELILPNREGEPDKFTDAFQAEMIGDPDSVNANKPEGLVECELGRRRAALWSALGEENPLAYLPKVKEGEKANKFATTSDQLSACLNILHKAWKSAAWAEVVSVFDPRVDAVMQGDSDRRLRVPVIHRLFASEAAARQEAAKQYEERMARKAESGSAPAAPAKSATDVFGNGAMSSPSYPTDWAGMEEDFQTEFKRTVSQGKANPLIAKEMSMTPAEVVAWRAHLGI